MYATFLSKVLGEKGIIIIIKIMRIIHAGNALDSNSLNFSWNRKCIDFRVWILAKDKGITDERGTSANNSN